MIHILLILALLLTPFSALAADGGVVQVSFKGVAGRSIVANSPRAIAKVSFASRKTMDVTKLYVLVEAKSRAGVNKSESVFSSLASLDLRNPRTGSTHDALPVGGTGSSSAQVYLFENFITDTDEWVIRIKSSENRQHLDMFRMTLCTKTSAPCVFAGESVQTAVEDLPAGDKMAFEPADSLLTPWYFMRIPRHRKSVNH